MALVGFQGDELYLSQEQILTNFIAAFQAAIPDVWLGVDGNLRILLEIEAGQIEGLFLANQLLLQDMFVQTAGLTALERHGEQFGVPRKTGTYSQGTVTFNGQGGVYIGIGTEVAYDPGGGADPLYFITTEDGTTPNPGIPIAPVATVGSGVGVPAGTYEYAVSFITDTGETTLGESSNAVILNASGSVVLTIPTGGPGTISRNVYRSSGGGDFSLLTTIGNNTTTSYEDTSFSPIGTLPPTVSTASQITLNAQSETTGSDNNAVVGAIRILANVPDGLTDVTNNVPFVGGTDEEDIDDYRTRLLNVLRSPSSGSPIDLQNWAEAVDGVESATIFPNNNLGTTTPGHVTVRISGPGSTIPPQSVIDAVASALADQDLANITIHVGVFDSISIDVAVTTTIDSDYSLSELVPNIQGAVSDYVNSIPVGGTLYITGIIQHVREVVGVLDVSVTTPTTNQTASATAKFVAGTVTVS